MSTTPVKHLLAASIAIGLIGMTTPVDATSGRTNAKGCHNSKKAGYHCHGTPKPTPKKAKSKKK